MYAYLLYFIKFYPFIYYFMTIYNLYEYIQFTKKIYSIVESVVHKFFAKKKQEKEIDEIYELIMETEPGNVEITIDDDTYYVKYNEKHKKIYNEWFNPHRDIINGDEGDNEETNVVINID